MKINSSSKPVYVKFFGENTQLTQQSASGRMDVMGGIADYSGSMVLQMPIKEKTTVTLGIRQYNQLRIKSVNVGDSEVFIDLDELPNNYNEAHNYLKSIENSSWVSYIVGCYLVLKKEKKVKLDGLDVLVESEIPLGKGVSSSAALEVATFKALAELFEVEFEGTELPKLAQKAENLVVGAPCGLMDQLASYFGRENYLLPIQCQPDILHEPIQLPDNLHFIGVDSGIRHAVSGASYSEVRTAAFMGYSIISQKEGIEKKDLKNINSTENLPFSGYLTNIPPSLYESKYARNLTSMYGKDFVADYETIIDNISTIKPDSFYNIKACTEHPIYENLRVKTFISLLKNLNESNKEEILPLLGELMYQSHESYNKCGLGNEMTDKIVDLARKKGHQSGIFGAKITGGGSGGTVCILAYGENGLKSVNELFDEYKSLTNFQNLHLFV